LTISSLMLWSVLSTSISIEHFISDVMVSVVYLHQHWTFLCISQIPLSQMEPNTWEMLLGWFSTFHKVFLSFVNSTWVLGWIAFWLVVLIWNILTENIAGIFIGWYLIKCICLLIKNPRWQCHRAEWWNRNLYGKMEK
jgi:hypothetical protein